MKSNSITPYAESLIEYCMWYGKRSREDAIKLLDDSASPLWRLSCEQPPVHDERIIQDSDDE